MGWTDIATTEHNRNCQLNPSGLNEERSIVLPFVPPPGLGGRRRTSYMGEVLNAIMYIAGGDIAWRMLTKLTAQFRRI